MNKIDIKPYAYNKGFNDAKAGKDINANPYPALSKHFYQYEEGFFDQILTVGCVLSA